MAKQTDITSITETDAYKHNEKAANWETLGCTRISGFYLQKITKHSSWRYRYTDINKKRCVATIGRYPGMLPYEAALIARTWKENGTDPNKEKERNRQNELSEESQREHRTLRRYLETGYRRIMDTWPEDSRKQAESRIKNHFDNLLDKPMDEITKADITLWQSKSEAKGLAHNTIKRIYSEIKTILRTAVKQDIIAVDPLASFSLGAPTLAEQKRIRQTEETAETNERRMLTIEEVEALHAGLDKYAEELRQKRRNSKKHGKDYLPDLDSVEFPHWFIPFFHLGFHTGLRPGDLLSITWTEINIHFARLVKIPSKTSYKAARARAKPAEVDMPLNNTVAHIMRLWWQQSGEPLTGLVFPSPVTGRQMDKKAYVKPWLQVKKAAGVSPDLNFYCLRHNFISVLVSQGFPLLTVAKLAGHKSTVMIEQHYGHLCPQQAAAAVDVLAQYAQGTKESPKNEAGKQNKRIEA